MSGAHTELKLAEQLEAEVMRLRCEAREQQRCRRHRLLPRESSGWTTSTPEELTERLTALAGQRARGGGVSEGE